MSNHFSSRTVQRYVFFFTMQRSIKNIISSKVNIFFLSRAKLHEIMKNVLHLYNKHLFDIVQTNQTVKTLSSFLMINDFEAIRIEWHFISENLIFLIHLILYQIISENPSILQTSWKSTKYVWKNPSRILQEWCSIYDKTAIVFMIRYGYI